MDDTPAGHNENKNKSKESSATSSVPKHSVQIILLRTKIPDWITKIKLKLLII